MRQIRQFFTNPAIDSTALRINGIGVQEMMAPGIVNRPMGTADYLFMFFYDPVLLQVEGKFDEFPANTLMLWTPEHGHYYGNTARKWKHSWIHCTGTLVRQFILDTELPRARPIVYPQPALMEKFLLEVYQEITEHASPSEIIVGNLLQNWFIETQRIALPEHTVGIPSRMIEARQFLEAHFSEPITLEMLAGLVNLSVPYFCNEFKRYFAVSAIDYLIRIRMHHAVYLLRDQNISISEIARQVGYPDIYYFSKLFKRHHGLCPRRMRQEMQS